MNTELKNLLEYVKGKEIEQGLDLSKLDTLVDALTASQNNILKDVENSRFAKRIRKPGIFHR